MNIVISGVSRGIGLEFVGQYKHHGNRVFACCRNPDQAKELQDLASVNVEIIQMDVSDQTSIAAAAELIASKCSHVDLLINNAGIFPSIDFIDDVSFENFSQVYTVNTFGPIMVLKYFQDLLLASDGPRCINISSDCGSLQEHMPGLGYSYASSKAALNHLTLSLARDPKLQAIISVMIHPGWVKTDIGTMSADLEIADSVSAMVTLIGQLEKKDSGTFIRYNGQSIPW